MSRELHTASNNFQKRGTFWLPENPNDKISGTLSFSLRGNNSLALDGSLRSIEPLGTFDHFRVPLIYGKAFDGSFFTIIDAFETSYQVNLPNEPTSELTYNKLAVGGKHIAPDTQTFESAVIDFTDFHGWMHRDPFITETEHQGNMMTIISYKLPDLITINVPSLNSDILITSNFNKTDSYQKRKLNHFDTIRIKPDVAKDLNWYFDIAHKFRILFSLLVGRAVHYSDFKLCIYAKQFPDQGNKWLREHVDLGFRQQGEPPERELLPAEIPFTYPILKDEIEYVLQSFFSKQKEFSPLLGLYFSTNVDLSMPVEFQFLALIQGLESYHRMSGNDKYVSDYEYRLIANALCRAIPNRIDGDLRAALKSRINFGNEFALRKRLKLILENIPQDIKAEVTSGDEKFITKVVATRNYLTHRDESQRDNIFDSKGIFNAASGLQFLIQFILLTEIGVSNATVSRVMRSHFRYINRPCIK